MYTYIVKFAVHLSCQQVETRASKVLQVCSGSCCKLANHKTHAENFELSNMADQALSLPCNHLEK